MTIWSYQPLQFTDALRCTEPAKLIVIAFSFWCWGLNRGLKIGSFVVVLKSTEYRVQSTEYRVQSTGHICRFNVDCEASAGLYGLAEGAFGTAGKTGEEGEGWDWPSFSLLGGSGGEGDDAGQCPAASALSEAECAGAVSTCWSPGQRDTDCPDNGLCCVSTRASTFCCEELLVIFTFQLTEHLSISLICSLSISLDAAGAEKF